MYTVRGQIIERSTTGVMGPYFPYDPVAVTDRFYDTKVRHYFDITRSPAKYL